MTDESSAAGQGTPPSAKGPSLKGLHIAALESRRASDMERLIAKYGGTPHVSPSMREVAVSEQREAIDFAYRVITGEINIVIFLTGVGFEHLLRAIERSVDKQRFLNALSDITTVVRGPKPAAALRCAGITATVKVPEPNTWRELLAALDAHVPITNQKVGLQEYGKSNSSLIAGLEARGAEVIPVRVYNWDLPTNIAPLEANIRSLIAGQIDALLFTSAHQAANLLRLSGELGLEQELRAALRHVIVASIGPTTSEMLRQNDLPVDLEPEHPKMGHLVLETAQRAQSLLVGRSARARIVEHSGCLPLDIHAAWYDGPFMRACRREASSVTPVWLMRQAGRYMAEYRAVREKIGFLDLCKDSALCAEVMVTAVKKLGVDAAIIFSDLLPILEPMGMDLEFAKGDGPVIHNPLREAKDVDRVLELESMETLDFVMETVRLTRQEMAAEIPVIGFSGAPFTLVSYMIEGGGSRNYHHTKGLMYRDNGAWSELMGKMSRTIARYLNAQIAAGAQCVQIFDSWAGCLSVQDYTRYVQPYVKQIIDSIVPDVPVINFATGNPALLPLLRGDNRTVVGIDWRIPLDAAWEQVGYNRAVQGNLDPIALLAEPETLREMTADVLQRAAGRAGHIFNLGHGILPQTPVDHAIALVDMVHELSQR
ncbi:MAG: uroporphyrinogen decarboxylase [Pirellulaceae bacterium]|jgi:uroporphyrinogen decarboxylase|nr:uroporphyrinogen decarboxylase [Pirellulaceae bacterium]